MRKRLSPEKELWRRFQPEYQVDVGQGPHLTHIRECLEIISDIEADKAGTSEEKHISMTE
jgi:hypothetical protein